MSAPERRAPGQFRRDPTVPVKAIPVEDGSRFLSRTPVSHTHPAGPKLERKSARYCGRGKAASEHLFFKWYSISFFIFLSSLEAYSAALLKTTIIEIATTSNSPGDSVTCIPKLFQKDGCLELKLSESRLITSFFGSLIYFKFIHASNKVADITQEWKSSCSQEIYCLEERFHLRNKHNLIDKFYSPLHKWAQMLQKQREVLLLFFQGSVSYVGKNGGMVGVAGGRDNILNWNLSP